MRKLILMTGAAIILPLDAFADTITCTATPNCRNLGYTEVSCPNDNGVRCPWGNYWFCPPETTESETCKNTCAVGNILYSDMTCSVSLDISKTPIGVVVYTDGQGRGQAMALDMLGKYRWDASDVYTQYDILPLKNYNAEYDFNSFLNTQILIDLGSKDIFPAAWAAYEYSTLGTETGEWSLPAAGIAVSIQNNLEPINIGFANTQNTIINQDDPIWTSTEKNGYESYALDTSISEKEKDTYLQIRPVFEFIETSSGICPYAYQYSCNGNNISGGNGKTCGGKYKSCTCDEGYVWGKENCVARAEWGQCNGYAAGCSVGDILYSDGTCSTNLISEKTAIAVVVRISNEKCGHALALKSIGNYKWATEEYRTSGYIDDIIAASTTISCEYSKNVMDSRNKDYYPAVWAAYNYSTEGTNVGDWCLPAAGILIAYKNNQQIINNGLAKAGGNSLNQAWSSIEYRGNYNTYSAWCFQPTYSNGITTSYTSSSYEVRPVIEF